MVNAEEDASNTPLESPLVDVYDDANKKGVFTIALRNINKRTGPVAEIGAYRNLQWKFDFPYLIPDVIRKFKTKDT